MIDKLLGVHVRVATAAERIIGAMGVLGFRMIVTDGVRTTAQQQALFAKGRHGNPGPIVTKADGLLRRSNHQAKLDGFGYAVDMCFLVGSGQASWDPSLPWRLYGEMAKAQGLAWGGEFTTFMDKCHIELPTVSP
jgi:peptidoglycan L-alanyl-D-glutamate endopeptidase CwlK